MVRRSILFSIADKYTGLLLSVVTMAVVARILTPAEVGLFMVASAAVILIEAFRDFGVGAVIIQERELTPGFVRTAFTIMALLSAVLGAGLLAMAGPLASFYDEPQLEHLVRVAALAFILAPFSTPLLALMRRDMEFGKLARIGIVAALVTSIATIGLALLGFGPSSFVWASVLASGATAIGAVLARPLFWVFRPSIVEWRRIVPFGAWSTIVTLLGMLMDFMPRLILGRVVGFDAVGLYTRAVSVCQLPERAVLSAVQPVVLPALAAELRAGKDLKHPYLLGLANVTAVQWPALVCLALLADPIVRLLLGDQWLGAIPLVRIVALATMFMFPVYLTYPMLVTLGRVRDMVTASLITVPPSLLILLGASFLGLREVAFSLFITGPLQVCVMLGFVRRHVPFAWGELARAVSRSALLSLCAAMVPAAIMVLSGSGLALPLPLAVIAGVGACCGWLVGLRLVAHPLDSEVRQVATAAWRHLLPAR